MRRARTNDGSGDAMILYNIGKRVRANLQREIFETN